MFQLKAELTALGYLVTHPLGSEIRSIDGIDRAYAPCTEPANFAAVEADYYQSISRSNCHFVCNSDTRRPGHVGTSARREVCFAMALDKPVIFTEVPEIVGDGSMAAKLMQRNIDVFQIWSSLGVAAETMATWIKFLQARPSYDMSVAERSDAIHQVRAYLMSL